MFSKHEASKLRQEFWTSFGLYMSPVLSADQEKINWINYKTGVKDISLRMDADNKSASIAIELSHQDSLLQRLYFDELEKFRAFLEQSMGEEWEWLPLNHTISGKQVSRVEKRIENVSIYRKEDWPALISFFKPRIIAFDEFWSTVKYSIEVV